MYCAENIKRINAAKFSSIVGVPKTPEVKCTFLKNIERDKIFCIAPVPLWPSIASSSKCPISALVLDSIGNSSILRFAAATIGATLLFLPTQRRRRDLGVVARLQIQFTIFKRLTRVTYFCRRAILLKKSLDVPTKPISYM